MITLQINKQKISIGEGSSVAAAIIANEEKVFRRSVSGMPRFPLCGMGVCFECRVSINSIKHQRSCQILAEDGMVIETDE